MIPKGTKPSPPIAIRVNGTAAASAGFSQLIHKILGLKPVLITDIAARGPENQENLIDLTHLPKGEVTIHMYLGTNDYKVWIVDAEPLFIEKTFMIE